MFPGNGATVSWTTSGTTGVQLLQDGGLFGNFGPSGSQTLPFECTGTPNTTQTHTYSIVTMGSSPAKSSVTASATINEITNVGPGGPTMPPVTPTPTVTP
jgi:hypothetical protein